MAARTGGQGRVKIDATGLANLRRAFKAMGSKAFDKHMAVVHKKIADRVVTEARPGIASQSSSAASAVTPVRSALGARIRIDPSVSPQAPGVIFGSVHDRPRVGPTGRRYRGYNQFRYSSGGPYHIYPEVDRLQEPIASDYVAEVHRFLDEQGVPR